jgi:hypothetical protein
MIDFEALLRKYIDLVGMCEGVDFIGPDFCGGVRTELYGPFTDEEAAWLRDEHKRSVNAYQIKQGRKPIYSDAGLPEDRS